VARAKRTDRAEARRRYRASQAAEDATDDSSLDNAGVADGSPARSSTERTAPAARPGLLGAFSGSIRRPDLRADLGYLPELIRNKAVWAPSLLTIAAGAAVFVPGVLASPLSIVIPLFVLQAPMAGPFLAGIWAPRASWLAGLIVGLISAVISSLYVLVVPVTGKPLAEERELLLRELPDSLLLPPRPGKLGVRGVVRRVLPPFPAGLEPERRSASAGTRPPGWFSTLG